MDHNASPTLKPSPMEALADVVRAAQQVVVDRIDLLRLEAKDTASTVAKKAGFAGAAGILGLLGWIGLMAAAVAGLVEAMPLWAALLIVGGLHVVAAAGLFFASAKAGAHRDDDKAAAKAAAKAAVKSAHPEQDALRDVKAVEAPRSIPARSLVERSQPA